MSENTRPAPACPTLTDYCKHCDLFADLEGLHVIDVHRAAQHGQLYVVVESAPGLAG